MMFSYTKMRKIKLVYNVYIHAHYTLILLYICNDNSASDNRHLCITYFMILWREKLETFMSRQSECVNTGILFLSTTIIHYFNNTFCIMRTDISASHPKSTKRRIKSLDRNNFFAREVQGDRRRRLLRE